jgi:hypothetical protein
MAKSDEAANRVAFVLADWVVSVEAGFLRTDRRAEKNASSKLVRLLGPPLQKGELAEPMRLSRLRHEKHIGIRSQATASRPPNFAEF